jgi:carbon-monoxide dehydrogenase small subunit
VEVGGQAIKSCTMLAVVVGGASVTTIEGLSGSTLDPVQTAFHEHQRWRPG